MKNNYLKKLQDTELDILCEIDRVCKKNNIRYFIMYGTLLGAVRHKGFIPWDDDIDIVMPRIDYEKFLSIASKELKSKYIIDFINTNKNYYLPFAKIKNKNTSFIEKNAVNYDGNNGIWVDIFPYDNYKTNKKSALFNLKFKIILFFHAIMINRSLKLNFKKSSFALSLFSKIFTNNFCCKIIKILSRGGKREDYVLYYSTQGAIKTPIFSKNDIFPLTEINFCGKKFYAPNNYKDVLIQLYGNDYMKLPPIEKRVTHNPIKIVFEDNETIEFDKKEGEK